MSMGVLLSRILGLVREQVVAVYFGASLATDAFTIAFRIPNLLRDLFAEGALSSAFVPEFIRIREHSGLPLAMALARRISWVVGLITGVLAALGYFFSPELVALFAPKFVENPELYSITVEYTKQLMPFFPMVSVAAVLMGVLNSQGVFFWPAFASALFNAGTIVIALLGAWYFEQWGIAPIYGLVWGTLLGGFLQLASQLPSAISQGLFRTHKRIPKDSETQASVWRILGRIVPGLAGLAATQVSVLINSIAASGMAIGSVTSLNFAFRLLQFPIGLFGVSIAQSNLSAFSKFVSQENLKDANASFTQSLCMVTYLNGLCTVVLCGYSRGIVDLLFGYGRFSVSNVLITSYCVVGYSVGLLAYSLVKVAVPVCYSVGLIRKSVYSGAISVIVTLVLNGYFAPRFGPWALALGTSFSVIGQAFYLLYLTRQYWNGRAWRAGMLKVFAHWAALGVILFELEKWIFQTQRQTPFIHLGVLVGVTFFAFFLRKGLKIEAFIGKLLSR